MNLRELRPVAIVIPLVLTVGFEIGRAMVLEPTLPPNVAHVVAAIATVGGVFVFTLVVFRIIERIQRRVVELSQELAAVNAVAGAATDSGEIEEGLRRSLDNVLAASGGDAVELLLWDERLQKVVSWIRAARKAECSVDLARLDAELVLTRSLLAGRSQFVPDLRAAEQLASAPLTTGHLRSFASVPLRVRDRTLGYMNLGAAQAGVLGASAEPLLAMLASQIGVALENRRLFQEIRRREREVEALYEIATEILSCLRVDQILQLVVDHTLAVLGAEGVGLYLRDERSQRMSLVRTSGIVDVGSSAEAAEICPLDGSPTREETIEHDVARPAWSAQKMLRAEGTMIGMLCARRVSGEFEIRELELLGALASHAAIALSNARLYEKAQYAAILEERDRIAREMHDSLAQVLGYLALQARRVRQDLRSGQGCDLARELEEIADVAEEAYVDVREAILGLRESIAPAAGLGGALSQYLQKFSRQSGITTKLVLPSGDVPRVPPAAEVQLVRIVQEALTNVRKHAMARHAWVNFEAQDGLARISIEDDGGGFIVAHAANGTVQGFGLRTMAERAERIGGTIEIDSAPGQGTRVTIRLPLAAKEGHRGHGSIN